MIRSALAMGADRGIVVESPTELQPLAVAKLLKAIVENVSPELLILGKQNIDGDCNQTGQMLAALLGWGQGTFACKIDLGEEAINVNREIGGGNQTLRLKLPAVVTTDLRLNEPRYVKLPSILKVKKKPLAKLTPEGLIVDVTRRLKLLKVTEPLQRKPGVRVADAAELVDKLRNEAQVI